MLTMSQKKAITRQLLVRYKKATKKEKQRLLDEFVVVTNYNRHYAAWVLRQPWKGRGFRKGKRRIQRPRVYDLQVFRAIKKIWFVWDCICSKRLVPFLPEAVKKLETCREAQFSPELRRKLLAISPATLDRMLAPVKRKYKLKGVATTKPGTLLKSQIPIRTFTDWDDKRPGFFEVDLVAHCGDSPRGEYANTVNFTDVATGWGEFEAVLGKAQIRVFKAINNRISECPLDFLGFDSDNDAPFINNQLFRYCEKNKITFTRCRPNKKNDQAFIEQKNYTVVRRWIGYARYDTQKQVDLINQIYQYLRPYVNFFQPIMKQTKKTRVGAKTKKWYDKAQTPCQRVLADKAVSKKTKQILIKQYQQLNPVELKRKIDALLKKLYVTLKVEN